MSQHLLISIRKCASKKVGFVNDESWVTETTLEIEGKQLYSNSTAHGNDGSIYKWSFGDFGIASV